MAGIDPAVKKYGRYPSSAATSYRSVSPEEGAMQGDATQKKKRWWTSVKDSLVGNTLVAVGLKPTENEERHWRLMEAYASEGEEEKDETDGLLPKNRSFMMADSGPSEPYTPSLLMRQVTKYSLGPGQQVSKMKSIRHDKSTGRNQAVNTNLRPDLWRVLYDSIKARTKQPDVSMNITDVPGKKLDKPRYFGLPGEKLDKPKSFDLDAIESDDEEEEEEEQEYEEDKVQADGVDETDGAVARHGFFSQRRMKYDDELFFDHEIDNFKKEPKKRDDEGEDRDEPDSAPAMRRMSPSLPKQGSSVNFILEPDKKDTMEGTKTRSNRGARLKLKKIWGKATLSGGYLDGYGGLGGVTKLLHFDYKDIPEKRQRFLDARFLHKRPYFTYWLMMVHVIIMVVALSVYGFAPYGFDLREEREFVRQTDLSLAPTNKMVVPSAWGGPPQQALVLLGAIFAPCMRSDRQIIDGIDADRQMENSSSGCCIHRDGSGCYQSQRPVCLPRFSDFIVEGNDNTRAVCGTSPNTCLEPSRGFSVSIWEPQDTSTWPICVRNSNDRSTEAHLRCELTSRPCCYGTQAICTITTPDHCQFLNGRFHEDAFLCSQVDCLNAICGLLPFANFNKPDQFYRLWLALFLHAGLIHLFLSLLFSFFVLRSVEKRLGWLRTTVIYVLSGIGGNLASAYLTPYNPEVGPAGSILGIVSYFFVFLIFESRILKHPIREFLKLLGVIGAFLLMGFLPFIDNIAHLGGFLFGFLISGVLIPFIPYKQYWSITKEDPKKNELFLYVKIGLIFVGLCGLVLLFVLFFVLLYVVQDTWIGFSYLTCIPFTSTLCVDQQQFIRNRTQVII